MLTTQATITIGVDEAQKVPVNLENLKRVTSIATIKARDNTALLIEYAPGEEKEYELLDLFEGPEGIKEVGKGGFQTILKILETITEQKFVLVSDDENETHYRREDLDKKIRE